MDGFNGYEWEALEVINCIQAGKTESEIMQAEVGIGLPVVTVLRNHGWTDAEIKQYEKDKAAEQMANAELAAAYMDQARRNSNDDEE